MEFKRSFRWQSFLALLFILAIFGYAYSCDYNCHEYQGFMNPKYGAYNKFFRAIKGTSSATFVMIAPLIISLICGDSLNIDRQQNMLPLFLARIDYQKYILKKIIALSIVGFIFVFSVLLLSYILAAFIFPYTFPVQKDQGEPWFWGDLCLAQPYFYLLINLCIQGLIGACFSIFALFISILIKNRFVGLALPWLIYLIMTVVLEMIKLGRYKPIVLAGGYLYHPYYSNQGTECLIPLCWLTFWALFSILTYICFRASFKKGRLC